MDKLSFFIIFFSNYPIKFFYNLAFTLKVVALFEIIQMKPPDADKNKDQIFFMFSRFYLG